jgi:DNA-binding XRE family transcriptional regulator
MRPEALLRPPLGGQPAAPQPVVAEPPRTEPTVACPPAGGGEGPPLLPGFRELTSRRAAGTARRLIAELTARRQSAGLSQTQVAARMGTSQSAVARLESGAADVRVSTLERYAAAVGGQLGWQLDRGTDPGREEPR